MPHATRDADDDCEVELFAPGDDVSSPTAVIPAGELAESVARALVGEVGGE